MATTIFVWDELSDNVFAASPVHSGQIRYLIKINLPKPVGGGQAAPPASGKKS
jgi:hypothetical protein